MLEIPAWSALATNQRNRAQVILDTKTILEESRELIAKSGSIGALRSALTTPVNALI